MININSEITHRYDGKLIFRGQVLSVTREQIQDLAFGYAIDAEYYIIKECIEIMSTQRNSKIEEILGTDL